MEVEAGLEIVKIPVYPEMKRVDPAACKGNISYYTFINVDAFRALREYLEEKRNLFGSILGDELLFYSNSNRD
jgi:site-specific recombinase XerD